MNLAGLAGAGAALLAASELAARALVRASRAYYVWRPHDRTHMRIDPTSLPTLEPLVRFEINSEGERGDELPAERRGLYRVLVAGGSAAEGYLLDRPSSWPGALQSLLSEREACERLDARSVHVGNIARSLVPCETILTMLQRVLPRYEKLDLVLLMVGASDAVTWMEQRCPVPLPEARFGLDYMFDEHCERRFGWKPADWALRQVVSRIARRTRSPRVRERTGSKLIELRERRRNAARWIDSTPDPEPMLARFEQNLAAMIELCRGKGARVIVVRQPWFDKELDEREEAVMWNFCIGRPYVETTSEYYTHPLVRSLLTRLDERAAATAQRLQVEQLDLRPLVEPNLANYYDYLHFTPQGARIVAEAVRGAVLSRAR
ncbi:MAG: GDSL-type esterase/lipase family protein [Planctomycetota bacterium]